MPYKAITSIRSDAQIRELLRRLCLRRFSTHIPSAQARSARASDSMLSPRNRARSCFQTAIQLDLPLRAAAYPLVGVRVHRCASRRNPTTLLRSRYSSIQREPHRKRQRQGCCYIGRIPGLSPHPAMAELEQRAMARLVANIETANFKVMVPLQYFGDNTGMILRSRKH